MKYCPNCGAEIKKGAKFCDKCGAKIGEEAKTVASTPNTNTSEQPKSRLAAGLLGIFLGWLGIHNFYLGYSGKGVGQLLITCLSCGILSPISAIWGLIEGICILSGSINTDFNGNPLGE